MMAAIAAALTIRPAHALRIRPPGYEQTICDNIDLVVVGKAVGLRDHVVPAPTLPPESIRRDLGMEYGDETVTIVTLDVEAVVHGPRVRQVEFLYSTHAAESPRVRAGSRVLAFLYTPPGTPLMIDSEKIDLERTTFGPVWTDIVEMDPHAKLVAESSMTAGWLEHCANVKTVPFWAQALTKESSLGCASNTESGVASCSIGVCIAAAMCRRRRYSGRRAWPISSNTRWLTRSA